MRLALALILAMLSLPGFAQEAGQQPDPVMQGAVDGVIRPGIISFAREASGLANTMDLLCAAPSAQALDLAEGQFRETALAFGRIELWRLGPLMEENRAERLLLWPDSDGVAQQKVEDVLAERDQTATDPATLRERDAALQGLVALEYVLFGDDAGMLGNGSDGFRCRYGLAIARGIATMGQELATGWYRPDGIAQHLLFPGPDNADYRSPLAATEALVALLSQGMEVVREGRVMPFIASGGRPPNPMQALFWRSGLTIDMLHANLHGLRDLFNISGVALGVEAQHRGLANSIEFEFANAHRALNLVTLPLDEAVLDARQAHALDYLVIVTGSLQTLIGEQLRAALVDGD